MDKSKVMPDVQVRCGDCKGPISQTASEKRRGVGRCLNPRCNLRNKEQPVSQP